MSVEATFKILGRITGSGTEKKMSIRALLSDTPTNISGGPATQSLTTSAAAIDCVSVVSGELIALLVHALTSIAYVDPTGVSTLASNYCMIPEGQFNL